MNDGLIDMEILCNSITTDTFLLAVMLVNNETGVIQDLKSITTIAKARDIKVLTDATQAVGKMPVDILDLEVELLAFSAHKMYGPKGIGALYVKTGIKLNPLIHGGGHEGGLRSGTLNVPSVIGFGKSCSLNQNEMALNEKQIRGLRDELENELLKLPMTFVNGSKIKRLYNITNICFPGLDANTFIAKNKQINVSNGSACSSAYVGPSHVLSAMNLSIDSALSSVRFSLSKFNNLDNIQCLITNYYTSHS
jgi:cysteine desulfurase